MYRHRQWRPHTRKAAAPRLGEEEINQFTSGCYAEVTRSNKNFAYKILSAATTKYLGATRIGWK